MLVVGDQAPYEEAAVSFSCSLTFNLSDLACESPCFLLWPLGGVQQQNGPNDDLIPKGESPWRLFWTCPTPTLLCHALLHTPSLCPPQMADAGGLPQLTQVNDKRTGSSSDAQNANVKAATSKIVLC